MHTSSSPAASHAERERNEAAFHDARIDDDGRKLGYAYASVKDLFGFTTVPRQFRHGSVLELGCFRGVRARALNGFPGRYTGIDISPAAVEHCKGLGLPANFEFRVDNANALVTVEDGEVD
jgi:SAM-dependent methyltransferase